MRHRLPGKQRLGEGATDLLHNICKTVTWKRHLLECSGIFMWKIKLCTGTAQALWGCGQGKAVTQTQDCHPPPATRSLFALHGLLLKTPKSSH